MTENWCKNYDLRKNAGLLVFSWYFPLNECKIYDRKTGVKAMTWTIKKLLKAAFLIQKVVWREVFVQINCDMAYSMSESCCQLVASDKFLIYPIIQNGRSDFPKPLPFLLYE